MPASVMKMPVARRAAQLYEQGLSQPQVAAAVGHSRKAVRTALAQLGVPVRTRSDGLALWRQRSQTNHPRRNHAL